MKKIKTGPRTYTLTPQSKPKNFKLEYLVENLFPMREVHLIGGPSGAGKTTILFQSINDMMQDKPMFDNCAAKNLPFVYAACDRSCASLYATMTRVKADFPVISIPELIPTEHIDDTVYTQLIPNLVQDNPEMRVLFLDGLATTLPGGVSVNDYGEIKDLLIYLLKICLHDNITIVGIVHSAKTKENEKYLNPREKILGSVAWAGFSDTIVSVDSLRKDGEVLTEVTLLPRQASQRVLHYKFDTDGKLVLSNSEPFDLNISDDESRYGKFLEYLAGFGGQEITKKTLNAFMHLEKIGKTTLKRFIDHAQEEERLIWKNYGNYKVTVGGDGPLEAKQGTIIQSVN